MPPMLVAPASAHSSRMRSTCSGESLTPGMSGATSTPVGMPARLSSATASIRLRGWGVCGSLARQAFSSSVGIERLAAKSGICLKSSMSRRSSGDLVSTEQGVRESRMASQTPGSSSYFFSTHW